MIQKPRLVICDIDSTLITSQRILTPYTKDVIEHLHRHGIYFGIASGRPLDELHVKAKLWGFDFPFDILIGMNGAELWDNIDQKEHHYFLLKREWMKEIFALMEPFDVNPFIYFHGKVMGKYMNEQLKKSARSSNKEIIIADDISKMYEEENAKIMFRLEKAEDMDEIEAYVNQHPSPYYQGFKTQSTLMEFADRRISKAYALQRFCEMHDFSCDSVIAFGDTSNDNEMLKVSGLGVCMCNGSDDTKAIANDITEKSNDEDGFAYYMDEHILKPLGI